MAILVSTARTQFELRKKDIADVGNDLFFSWCNEIHRYLYRKLTAIDPERFISSQTYTPSAHPTTSALPADFGHIRDDGCGVYLVDSASLDTETRLTQVPYMEI